MTTRGTTHPEALPLTAEEVAQRVADGQVNIDDSVESRSVVSILRANILTRFNAIISVLLVVILVFGELADAMFGLVMIANAAIGIIQELRAKRTLDKLTVIATPKANVFRADGEMEIPIEDIVRDDLLLLSRGQQIPVDGSIVECAGLEVNEALLTGEADSVTKEVGARVMSGSFVVSGTGMAVATEVGNNDYASHLAKEAKEFTLTKGELHSSIDVILRIVTWLMIPTAGLLLWSQLNSGQSIPDGLVSAVAGVVAMVPQGLVLLVSVSLAVAVIRLGERQALVQELPAVETLARVDTLCVDKTGTLTSGGIVFGQTVTLLDGADPSILGSIAAADPDPNATMVALGQAYENTHQLDATYRLPFSSTRKMSAVAFSDGSAWVIGAPEFVLSPQQRMDLDDQISAFADQAKRVLVVATTSPDRVDSGDPIAEDPTFLVVFAENIRSDAAETIRYFTEQGVELKVISGDSPDTVAAVARAVGISPVVAVDATELPDTTSAEFDDVVTGATVFGRVTPERKKEIVVALQDQNKTVAMTGDGVNDVLALKQADMGISMGSGAAATRAVAQLVLMDDTFASLPDVVGEGRRVVANMERVASLFLTKTVYATLLAVAIGFAGLAFPFLPRHMTLVGFITIGTPAFILSFEKQDQPIREGFLIRVLTFAIPAGLVAGLTTFTIYGVSRLKEVEFTIEESRTSATILMVFLGLVVIHDLVSPPSLRNRALIATLLGTFLVILAIPGLRSLFNLVLPGPYAWAVIIGATAVAAFVLRGALAIGKRYADSRLGTDST